MAKTTTNKTIDDLRASLPKRERRLIPTTEGALELRQEGDELRVAMFVPFNRWSHPLGAFREKIAPSAFRKTLKERSSDVVSLWNHDPNWVLGRESNDTLAFREKDDGQEGIVTLDADDPMHRHFARRVERRDVQGASFAFETVRDEWANEEDGTISRTLLEVRLFDWSPVTFPAYPDSGSESRSCAADVAAVRSGVDIPALAVLIASAKDGKVPSESAEEVRSWVTRLQGLIPEPEVPEYDYDLKISLRCRRNGLAA